MTAPPKILPTYNRLHFATALCVLFRELWNHDDDHDAAAGAPRLDHAHRSTTKPHSTTAASRPQLMDRRRERDRGGDRDRERDRQRERERDRDRGRDRDRDREWERERDRDRDDRREREKGRLRSRSRSRSPVDRHRRSQSYDRAHRDSRRDRERSNDRERSRERERSRDDGDGEKSRHKKSSERRDKRDGSHGLDGQRAAMVAEFVDGIANETQTAAPAVDDDENLMKKLGIPTGFTTTKGRYVADANHSAVKLTTKRTPRQYMNRRGGFNRPLPAESNR